jgi:hypothetical protein
MGTPESPVIRNRLARMNQYGDRDEPCDTFKGAHFSDASSPPQRGHRAAADRAEIDHLLEVVFGPNGASLVPG